MTEILTESFCERCGTRYTFETARPRNSRIGRAKTFTRGLRNYVLSDDSFSEAMADARGEEELAATVLQLDAFHKTFNFCLDCRQYTCGNCWNPTEGRCQSCAPLPGAREVELEPQVSDAIAGRLAAITAAPPERDTSPHDAIGIAAWPTNDLPEDHAPSPAVPPVDELASAEDEALIEAAASGSVDEELDGASMLAPDEIAHRLGLAEDAGGILVGTPEPEPVAELATPEVPAPGDVAAEGTVEPAVVDAVPADALRVADLAVPEPVAAEPVAALAEPEIPATVEAPAEGVVEAPPVEAVVEAPVEAAPVEAVVEAPVEVVAPAPAGHDAPSVVGLAPGQSLEEAIAAYEAAQLAEPAGAIAAPPTAVEAPEADKPEVAAPEAPQPVEAEPEPEPAAARAELVAVTTEPAAVTTEAIAAEPEADVVVELEAKVAPEPVVETAAPSVIEAEAPEVLDALAPEPVAADLAATEVIAAEPVAAEPVAAEPVAAEPTAEPQLVAPEPVAPEPPSAQPVPADVPLPESVVAPERPAPGPDEAARPAVDLQPPAIVQAPVVRAPEFAEPAPIAATAAPVEAAPAAPAAPTAPAAPVSPLPGWLAVAPDDGSAPPNWPQRAAWPATSRPPMTGTLAGRKLMNPDNAADIWTASAKEVMQGGPLSGAAPGLGQAPAATPQPCVGCGLQLSATARFCRRCGTRQG